MRISRDIHTHTYIYTYIRIHTYTHTHTHACTYTYIYRYTYIIIHTYITYTYLFMCKILYECTHTCTIMHIIRSSAAAIPEPRKQLPRFWKFAPGRGQLGVPRRSVLELDLPPPFPPHRWAFGSSPSLQVKGLGWEKLNKNIRTLPPYPIQNASPCALFFCT